MATTQATTQEGNARVHYLRTSNPANPENLAVYPRRLPTNRPNPYDFPDAFKKLAAGLLAYETRQCTGCSGPDDRDRAAAGPADRSDLADPGRSGGERAEVLLRPRDQRRGRRPPCKQQGKFPFGGEVTQYPHVNPATGATARALARTAQARTRTR